MSNESISPKNWVATLVLCIFLGYLGVHRFYVGKVGTGILKGHPERLWVNPDCGLKTREWAQVLPSLENMVKASAEARAALGV